MPTPPKATVLALRRDVAYQIARRAKLLGASQLAVAKELGIPQPTLSKIINGRVADLSLELLIRIAVTAGLPMVLQTGRTSAEAGAFVSGGPGRATQAQFSALAAEARERLAQSERALTPAQRAEAFLEHNQIVAELRAAGRNAGAQRGTPGVP